MPLEQGTNDITVGYVGSTQVTAGYVGSTQVFGGSTSYTLSGSITDNVTNGNVQTEYSVSGALGATGTFNVTLGPDTDYEFTSSTTVTYSGVGSNLTAPATCSLSAGNLVCVFNYTLPSSASSFNANRVITDNFGVTATATAAARQFTCSDWTGSLAATNAGDVALNSLGNAGSVSIGSHSCPDRSDECSNGSCNVPITITVPNNSSAWSNANQNISCTVSNLTVPAGGSNGNAWGGSFTVTSAGAVTLTNGNWTNVSRTGPASYPSNAGCNVIPRSIVVSGTNDNGCTASAIVTYNQPGSAPQYNPTLSDVTVASNGTVTNPNTGWTVNWTNVQPANRSQSCVGITLTYTLSRSIPTGFCGSGSTITTPQRSTFQSGGGDNWGGSDWDGSISVSSAGVVTVNEGSLVSSINVSAPTGCTGSIVNGVGSITCPAHPNTSCGNITRLFSLTGFLEPDNSSYCNAGDNVSWTYGASQAPSQSSFSFNCSSISINGNGIVSNSPNYATYSPTSFSKVNSNTNRTVTVTGTVPNSFCNGGSTISQTCTVVQPASAANTISVSPSSVQFDGTGEVLDGSATITVTLGGSVTYSVSDNRSWITTSSSGTTTTISVSDNNGGANRKGTVTFRHGSDSSVTTTVAVTQVGSV